jgi:hypothetical protein
MDLEAREPIEFEIGDSLYFTRCLPEFPPVQGSQNTQSYYIKYSLFSDGGAPMLSFVSVPGPGQNEQMVLIDNFGQLPNALTPGLQQPLTAGLYVLVGAAIGQAGMGAGGGTETHEIYRGKLKMLPNFNAGLPVPDMEWEEQKMVKLYRKLICQLAQTYVNESDIQRVKLVREKQKEIRTELNFWEDRLRWRQMAEDARNGRPDPSSIRAVFSICG